MLCLIKPFSGPYQEHCSVKYLFNVLDKDLMMAPSDKICCPFIHFYVACLFVLYVVCGFEKYI